MNLTTRGSLFLCHAVKYGSYTKVSQHLKNEQGVADLGRLALVSYNDWHVWSAFEARATGFELSILVIIANEDANGFFKLFYAVFQPECTEAAIEEDLTIPIHQEGCALLPRTMGFQARTSIHRECDLLHVAVIFHREEVFQVGVQCSAFRELEE
jgi:hypothetical protein